MDEITDLTSLLRMRNSGRTIMDDVQGEPSRMKGIKEVLGFEETIRMVV